MNEEYPFKRGDLVRVKGTKRILTVRCYIPNLLPPVGVEEEKNLYFPDRLELVKRSECCNAESEGEMK